MKREIDRTSLQEFFLPTKISLNRLKGILIKEIKIIRR